MKLLIWVWRRLKNLYCISPMALFKSRHLSSYGSSGILWCFLQSSVRARWQIEAHILRVLSHHELKWSGNRWSSNLLYTMKGQQSTWTDTQKPLLYFLLMEIPKPSHRPALMGAATVSSSPSTSALGCNTVDSNNCDCSVLMRKPSWFAIRGRVESFASSL